MIDTIKIPTLKELVKAGADLHLNAMPVTGGFSLTIKTKAGTRMLSAQRGNLRVFKKLDAIVSVLEQVGLTSFEFNLTQQLQLPRVTPPVQQSTPFTAANT